MFDENKYTLWLEIVLDKVKSLPNATLIISIDMGKLEHYKKKNTEKKKHSHGDLDFYAYHSFHL